MDENPANPRRRFQFSLRALMIGVTLSAIPCGWLGWQARMVALRKSLRESNSVDLIVAGRPADDSDLPAVRRWLGDKSCLLIGLANSESQERIVLYRSAFPESRVVRSDDFDREYTELVKEGKADFLPTPLP